MNTKNKMLWLFAPIVLSYLFLTPANGQTSHAPSMQGPPVSKRDLSPFSQIVNIHGDDGFYLKKNTSTQNVLTIVDGKKILGSPFLFEEWFDGIINTPDERTYNYKLRYNTYKQTVSFKNGNDSLDVSEEIKDFFLTIPVNDTVIVSHFVNASQYRKEKLQYYYEILLDGNKGQLLKATHKVINKLMSDELLGLKGKLYFSTENDYYYFEKASKKIIKIPCANDDCSKYLTPDTAMIAKLNSLDLNNEDELIQFFKLFLKN
jgi:hypothetical protein